MKYIINNKIENLFPPPAVFAGYVFLIIGTLYLIVNIFVGIGLLLSGGFISFTFSGVQIYIEDKKYKVYTSLYGIKIGKSKSLNEYLFLAVLSSNQSYGLYSMSNISMSDTKIYYDICLLNSTQRQRLVIKRHKNFEKANLDAKEIADKLEVQLTTFNPPISDTTNARR